MLWRALRLDDVLARLLPEGRAAVPWAEWLVAKDVKNIGFDFFEEYCARLPDFSSEDFPMHRVILGAGVVIMEGLTNLAALPQRRVDFAAPFYKIAGTEGAPARFFARVE